MKLGLNMAEKQRFTGYFQDTLDNLTQKIIPELQSKAKELEMDFAWCSLSLTSKEERKEKVLDRNQTSTLRELINIAFSDLTIQADKLTKGMVYDNYSAYLKEKMQCVSVSYCDLIPNIKDYFRIPSDEAIKLEIRVANACYTQLNTIAADNQSLLQYNVSTLTDRDIRANFIMEKLQPSDEKYSLDYINQIVEEQEKEDKEARQYIVKDTSYNKASRDIKKRLDAIASKNDQNLREEANHTMLCTTIYENIISPYHEPYLTASLEEKRQIEDVYNNISTILLENLIFDQLYTSAVQQALNQVIPDRLMVIQRNLNEVKSNISHSRQKYTLYRTGAALLNCFSSPKRNRIAPAPMGDMAPDSPHVHITPNVTDIPKNNIEAATLARNSTCATIEPTTTGGNIQKQHSADTEILTKDNSKVRILDRKILHLQDRKNALGKQIFYRSIPTPANTLTSTKSNLTV